MMALGLSGGARRWHYQSSDTAADTSLAISAISHPVCGFVGEIDDTVALRA